VRRLGHRATPLCACAAPASAPPPCPAVGGCYPRHAALARIKPPQEHTVGRRRSGAATFVLLCVRDCSEMIWWFVRGCSCQPEFLLLNARVNTYKRRTFTTTPHTLMFDQGDSRGRELLL
jgi:hypothetical protein